VHNKAVERIVFWSIVLIGFAQGLFYAWNVVMTSDQEQLLEKGIRLAFLGEWEHYGNLVTSGGNVPGSLTTALVGLPLMLADSSMAPQLLIGLLQLASLGLLVLALRGTFTPLQIIVFCGLFWLSPWRVSKAVLWNPSYLFFATALHLYSFHRLIKKPKDFWMSFLHVLAMGYAFELHPSALLLVIMSGFLYLRKSFRINWLGVALALTLIVVTLIPWFLVMQGEQNLAPVVDESKGHFYYGFSLVHPFSFIKGVSYWPRYNSFVFPHYIFSNLDYSRFGGEGMQAAVRQVFDSLRWLLGGASVLLALWAFGWQLRRIWKQGFRCPDPLENYILAGLIAMVVLVAMSPAELSHWHLFILLPVANISFCRFLFHRFQWLTPGRARAVFCAVMLYFILFNLMANFTAPNYYSTSHNMRADYPVFKASVIAQER
jgi:hypothetical protein